MKLLISVVLCYCKVNEIIPLLLISWV